MLSIQKDNAKGIGFLILGLFIFTTLNALLKGCDQTYPASQVVFFRSCFALLPYLLIFWRQQSWQQLKITNLPTLIWLGIMGAISLALLFESIILLPLADATVYMFSASLFVTALSQPLIGERVSPQSWVAVLIGFVGIMIMAKPSGEVFNMGAAIGVASAVMQAIWMLYSRKLSQINTGMAIVFHFSLAGTVVSALTLPFVWVQPTLKDLVYLIILGVGGGVGQYFIVQAYRFANASVLAPMLYSSMIWSFLYGMIFFDEIPTKTLYIGGGLIIAAGLLVIYFENYKRTTRCV